MKFSTYGGSYAEYEAWRAICPEGHWKRLSPSALRGRLPDNLLDKTNAVFLLSSASPDVSAFVVNINRVEPSASAIDQEVFVMTFDHSASAAEGYFVHHGQGQGRTVQPGSTFFAAVAASGVEHHYPYQHMPPGSSGVLSDLVADPNATNWWNSMKQVRRTHPSS